MFWILIELALWLACSLFERFARGDFDRAP